MQVVSPSAPRRCPLANPADQRFPHTQGTMGVNRPGLPDSWSLCLGLGFSPCPALSCAKGFAAQAHQGDGRLVPDLRVVVMNDAF